MMEHYWENRWQEQGPTDCGGSSDSSGDEVEGTVAEPAFSSAGEDEADEDGGSESDGGDEDSSLFDVAGISAWDMFGEGFECEASALGLFLPYKFSTCW